MKNTCIIESWNKIDPDRDTKDRILGEILLRRDAERVRTRSLTAAFTVIAAACVVCVVSLITFAFSGSSGSAPAPLLPPDTDGKTLPAAVSEPIKNGPGDETTAGGVPAELFPTEGIPSGSEAAKKTSPEVCHIPQWNEREIYEQYSSLEYNGIEFSTKAYKTPSAGRLLGKAAVYGYDTYSDKEYTMTVSVYALPSVSEKCAVAVKFDGYDGFYSYVSAGYKPETLGMLIDDLNLRENLLIGEIYYDTFTGEDFISSKYTLADPRVVWEYLLSDTALPNAGDAHYTVSLMSVAVGITEVGYKKISLAVNADGYLQTNILETGKSFFIGKDKVQAFVDYVLNNAERTELARTPAGQTPDAGEKIAEAFTLPVK